MFLFDVKVVPVVFNDKCCQIHMINQNNGAGELSGFAFLCLGFIYIGSRFCIDLMLLVAPKREKKYV